MFNSAVELLRIDTSIAWHVLHHRNESEWNLTAHQWHPTPPQHDKEIELHTNMYARAYYTSHTEKIDANIHQMN
jgi:hypothetical protein